MKRESSAGAIVFYQNPKNNYREYLLLYYLNNNWDFPRGKIELQEKEKPLNALKRELKEETGLINIEIIKGFEKKNTFSFKSKGEFVIKDITFYLVKTKSQNVKISQEHKGFVWLPYEKAFRLITFNKNILKNAEFFLRKKNQKGFTFIEILLLLVLISTIFISTFQILKPSSYLQKVRDIKRITDLKNLDLAIKTYLMATSSPNLGPNNKGSDEASSTIFISIPFNKEDLRNSSLIWNNKSYYFSQVSSTYSHENNGYGWLPVNFQALIYPPIFSLPLDPLNFYSSNKLFYSYIFNRSNSTFEINAKLEFSFYQQGGNEDKVSTDNGDNPNILEVGNNKTLMPNNLY